MKKETKDLLICMVETWNKFNQSKSVDAHFDELEFSPKQWSLDLAIVGVVNSDFMNFLLPAIYAHDCIWFMNACGDNLILHIQ